MWLPCKKEGQCVSMAVSRIPGGICVRLSKETLKGIDYNFAHQSR